jgi:hypothetical protein
LRQHPIDASTDSIPAARPYANLSGDFSIGHGETRPAPIGTPKTAVEHQSQMMVDHFARPKYPRTDRANGRYHHRGDLLISQTVDFTTHDCHSMRRRQRLERRIHREPNIVGER